MLGKSKSRKVIDLAAYADKRRRRMSFYDFHAVYVISSGRREAPRKIGIAGDPARRLSGLQTGQPDKLYVEYLLWTPAPGIASAIERAVHKAFKKIGAHKNGEWFNVSARLAAETVRLAAEKLFPAIEFSDHEQLLEMLANKDFGTTPAANYSEQERNLLVRAIAADGRSPVLPKLGIHIWAELFRPMIAEQMKRYSTPSHLGGYL